MFDQCLPNGANNSYNELWWLVHMPQGLDWTGQSGNMPIMPTYKKQYSKGTSISQGLAD